MEVLKHNAINLIIDIANTKSIESIEYLLESLSYVLEEEDIDFILKESALFLTRHNKPIADWFINEIVDCIEYVRDDESIIEISSIEDIDHILLDEGFEKGKDYFLLEGRIHITKNAKHKLDNILNTDEISHFILLCQDDK